MRPETVVDSPPFPRRGVAMRPETVAKGLPYPTLLEEYIFIRRWPTEEEEEEGFPCI